MENNINDYRIRCDKTNYRIFELCESTSIILLGKRSKYKMPNPLFKIQRRSISEGIFESLLASRASVSMENGNTYMIYHSDYQISSSPSYQPLYIHCEDEYMYIGMQIESND